MGVHVIFIVLVDYWYIESVGSLFREKKKGYKER
jgi:hypothetical protein